MIELKPIDYGSVLKFLPGLQLDTVIAYSIIGNKQPGRIFVDNGANPTAVLFWHRYGAAVLTGNCGNTAFNEGVKALLLRRYENNQQRITISIDNTAWKLTIEEMLRENLLPYSEAEKDQADIIGVGKRRIIVHNRLRHRFNNDKFNNFIKNIKMENKYNLDRINRDVYPKIFGRVVPASFWDSAPDFFNNGAGYCLMDGDKFACVSFSAYIGNGQIDVGIETNPEYRRQGLGPIPAAAMVTYCLEHGYQPVWGCLQDNAGSALIARKLGFEPIGTHPVYFSIER